ncbi:MAG: hypothetical protein OHK93_005453 [Ramalina farinacea]|uniref:DUF7907 domain-containing protein n=1 Tax=Ramalina farinacea TaxID=258253 RepID=A0AA43TVY2_9LECA|nr:hypothetical protein [Ramalina farinacea]
MASFIVSTLLAFLPLSVLASPLPTDPVIQSPYFKLLSRPLDASLTNLTDLYLESYHIYPTFADAVLEPKTEEANARVGFLNGTQEEFENDNAVSPSSPSPCANFCVRKGKPRERKEKGGNGWLTCAGFPYGFVIDRSFNESYIPAEINVGNGTQGIFIDQGVIKVHDPLSGGFYACNKTLLYGTAIQLFYKIKYIATPAGCGDVELVVEYVDSSK